MKHYGRYIDYLIEINIILLFFAFPLYLAVFNKLWDSVIIIWLLGKIVRKEKWEMPPSGYFILIFLGTIVLSVIFSSQPDVNEIKNVIKGIILSLVLFDYLRSDEKRINRIVHYFIASALITSCYAIYEIFILKDIGIRVQSFFQNTFFLALWSGIGLVATVSKLLSKPSKAYFIVYEVVLIILGAALMLSKTRAPLLAVGIIGFLILLYAPNKINLLKYLAVLGALSLLIFIYDDTLRIRVLSIFNDSTELRWTIWNQSVTLIKEKFSIIDWIIGKGPGLFKQEYTQIDKSNFPFTFPHLLPLELFYSSGLICVFSFFAWIIFVLHKLHIIFKSNALDQHIKYIGLLPFLVLLICFTNESFFSKYFSFPFWFFTGVLLSLVRNEKVTIEKYESNQIDTNVA
ncbi:MAG: O-antigen ligase family protein [Pseudomonadota bacterium]